MAFCKDFNAKSASQGDMIIPVVITVFSDRSLHLRDEDAARVGSAEEGGRARDDEEAGVGLEGAEQDQGRAR